jgi:dipeptide/tripeptide permease
MNDAAAPAAAPRLSWRFPATFWFANVAELFERAAYYAMFIGLTLYLTNRVGFNDVHAGWVGAFFSFGLYLLPVFMGTFADAIGFRPALMLAFALLTAGYGLLGAFQLKSTALLSLALIMLGGAIVKPVILGTAAKCSDADHRARAFSIFYFMVNVGSFTGKTVAAPLREKLGLEYINFYAAAMAFTALVLVAAAYRSPDAAGRGRSFLQLLRDFFEVLGNGRFMCLIVIIAGFWLIQGQLYASMPKYILRLVGAGAKPEWLANINPLVVVTCVVPITHLVRHMKPASSIAIALCIIPLSALAVALSPILQGSAGNSVSILGLFSLHPVTVMVILGIGLQGLAECFLSPKFMEFASKQAPRGQEGMYMGFQNLPTSIAWFLGFMMSGYLLDAFCPDPARLATTDPAAHAQWQAALAGQGSMPAAYASAHYIWYVFAGVGVAAFLALLVFKAVTEASDRRPAAPPRA